MKKSTILITGAHRSGSTWTGKIISESKKVRYVHEPFNIDIKKYDSPFIFWFQYITQNSNLSIQNIAIKYLNSFQSNSVSLYAKNLTKCRSLKSIILVSQDYFARFNRKTLFKDPIALLSSEWLSENIDADIIINIRHPAAFIASIKVKNWQFDFENFLKQEQLMIDHFASFKNDIEAYSKTQPDIIDQGILIWNCLYSVVNQYQKRYSDSWYFVKHEDLSLNPTKEFEKIFNFLKLPFDQSVKKKILETTRSTTSTDSHRDSKANIKSWKNRLSTEEIQRIKIGTNPLWKKFYTEEDW